VWPGGGLVKWSVTADRKVIEAVVSTFRDEVEASSSRLSALSYRKWQRSVFWLDASGMALYFLGRVQSAEMERVLPVRVIERLRENLADNAARSAVMFEEFLGINEAFQNMGVQYANLKGFTLAPHSCSHPSLRCQLDLDFLVDGDDLDVCRSILESAGYIRTAATEITWEFKAGAGKLASIEDHYKPKPQRSVELHFASDPHEPGSPGRDERLDRLSRRSWGSASLPVLTEVDQLIGQAVHLLGHLRGESTRLAWILEYQHHVVARRDDPSFWNDLRQAGEHQREVTIALGIATLLATHIFGEFAPAELNEWTVDRLPPAIRLWADHYGRRAALAGFPGTKLYLFLEAELRQGQPSWQTKRRSRLLPLHRAPRIVHGTKGDRFWTRLRREFVQLRFVLFRLRFHVTQGVRYMLETVRWKRLLASLEG
jgi:hypothetical protein